MLDGEVWWKGMRNSVAGYAVSSEGRAVTAAREGVCEEEGGP
jgi:hypothetical protein